MAIESPPRAVIAFVLAAAGLAVTAVATRAHSATAMFVAGGAVILAILVPTYLAATLRRSVNDRFGHSVGDAMLVAVSGALAEAVPPATLVARTGREEFVIVRNVADEADLHRLCRRCAYTSLRVPMSQSASGRCVRRGQ
ncbi:MAG: diguanylate cyclase [Actinomycetota bacterium]|nr:diguanylate cyclase [Actinomycetota bacterium]